MARRALCIGINNYPGTDNDLQGCVNDAKDWLMLFQDWGFDEVITLFDKEATKEHIVEELERGVRRTTSKDIFVPTFSGHGTWTPDEDGDEADGRDEALCPWDMGTTGAIITDDELFAIFDKRQRGSRIVFISDSCHSGSVSRMAAPIPGWSGHRKIRFMPPEHYVEALKYDDPRRTLARMAPLASRSAKASVRHACLLLSGCRDPEYSYDCTFNGRPNGAMTYVALQALKKLGPDATYASWYKAIRAMLPSQSAPQTPQLYGTTAMKRWKVFAE